ncbi:MAG: ABC-F family ATP-binding cassette domain-containing protein [Bacilli bacterium]|nr:ABC-F family ATP-binding cassette domain-containing protein [Bacilli bacterium]
MIELSLSKVTKTFGFDNILDTFDLEVSSSEKIALIGPNGCGKSTILKLIMKEEYPIEGKVTIRKGAKVAMLSQHPPKVEEEYTVKDLLTENFKEVYEVEKAMRELENQMSLCTPDKLQPILHKYDTLQQKFLTLNGYEIDSKVDEICNKFNLDNEMLNRKFNSLSGGEKTIVHFASIMLGEPTILLLDEPTNHLDLDALEWLENYLNNFKGTILLSSHDRYFLDKVTNKTVLIERGKGEVFHGNYSYYLVENEKRILHEFEQYKDQQKMIEAMKRKVKKLQEFGRRADPNGESFFKRAASIQKRLDKIEKIEKPSVQSELPLSFKMGDRSGKQVLGVKNFDLSVPGKELLTHNTLDIRFQDKICLMGKNGSGKSTFIKYIMDLSQSNGMDDSIKLGSNIKMGYIPQIITFENENITILEYARKSYEGTETHLRASLSKFMFHDESIFKRVGNLSGGEKVRLKLFELIQQNINFLIMDEPTNHIDITTKEVLETALKEYPGTLLFISHDRYFINELAKKIFYIEDKKINEYIGNYDDYLASKERQSLPDNNRRIRKSKNI